LENKKSSDLD
jgi:hypothetical protein